MIGTKRISDLITSPNIILPGKINIIDAGVSAGKTHFALTTIPQWSSPEKILYLIDTTNGEMRLQLNMLERARKDPDAAKPIDRLTYAFCDYNTKHIWGDEHAADGKMPIMTYAGFGSEAGWQQRNKLTSFKLSDFDYIICDEMQNMVHYQHYKGGSVNVAAAEDALINVLNEGKTKIVALSATPQAIRDRTRLKPYCYDVPFDRTDLQQLETFHTIPYNGKAEDILLQCKGKRGILYVAEVRSMKRYIGFANSIGMRANGFWSTKSDTQKDHPMSDEQFDLLNTILGKEVMPRDLDLLVINAASETCIKIQPDILHPIEFMIVHNCNDEIKTQVRGRYNGDLQYFYFHDIEEANSQLVPQHELPERYLNKRIYSEDWKEICAYYQAQKPHGGTYGKETIIEMLKENGYHVSESKKDSKNGGKWYRVISKA